MRQIGHIFWKDVRFLWLDEIALLLILAYFGAVQAVAVHRGSSTFYGFAGQSQLLPVVVTLSWVILIIRLVQAERLAGRNQFWTTKPYAWGSLLTAKLLYLLAFVYAPLLLMQMAVLGYAQLPVLGNAGNLLLNAALLTAYLVLPVVCVAALTRSFAMTMLSLLCGYVLVMIGVGLLWSKAGSLSHRQLVIQLTVGVVALGAAVLAQYWRRRTVIALGICAAGLLVAVGMQVALGQRQHTEGPYTRMLTDAPVSIQLDRDLKEQSGGADGLDSPQAQITLPLTVSPVPEGTSYVVDGQTVAFAPQDGTGFHGGSSNGGDSGGVWRQRLEPVHGMMNTYHVQETVSAKEFLQMTAQPVNVRVELSLTEMHSEVAARVEASAKMYKVPGVGTCRLDQLLGMTCVTAFVGPRQLTSVRVGTQSDYCTPQMESRIWSSRGGNMDFIVARGEQGLPGLSISPIEMGTVRMRALDKGLCEGTPLEFVVERPVRRITIVMPTATVNIRQYAQKSFNNQ